MFHLAAQVAVTTSVTNPREDFDVNALGTFNVLEAVRLAAGSAAPCDLLVHEQGLRRDGRRGCCTERNGRYAYADLPRV